MMINATLRRRVRSFISSSICACMVTSSSRSAHRPRMISFGSHASAIAIINDALSHATRELMRILLQSSLRIGDADQSKHLIARLCAVARSMPRCCSSVSVICRPMVRSGFNDVIGSWKIMPMSPPRISRISASESCMISRPAKRISPRVMRPGSGSGMRRRIDSALTDLPEPLSPTMATVSPGSTV